MPREVHTLSYYASQCTATGLPTRSACPANDVDMSFLTLFAVHRYNGRRNSTLEYTQHHSADTSIPSIIARQPRRRVVGRIHIIPLRPHHPEYELSKPATDFSQHLFDKLAGSRETAKRFLRSFVAQNSGDSTQQPTDRAKRRLSLPVARHSPEERDTVRMRGVSRTQANEPTPSTHYRPRFNSDLRNVTSRTSSASATSTTNQSAATTPLSGDSSIVDGEKPVAAGNGVSVSIQLAEPMLFLQGSEGTDASSGNTAMLRGSLHVRVQKSAKIKAISLRFKGRALTRWPEGIPPRKQEFEEVNTIMNHTWPFFNAQFDSAELSTGADHVQLAKPSDAATSTMSRIDALGRSSPNSSQMNLSTREAKRLSLQVVKSKSFEKGETRSGTSVATKGYRTFHPGVYVYNFELPIDSRLPETIDVDLGNVKYELEAVVERSGAFRANLAGTKEVRLIRAPAEGSLEQVEPIAISRTWEDQLHYDIVISGKSFPLGAQVPIAFKLTPLAKVRCHRIKVLITENVEYFCANKHVHRMEPPRKVQLFEKRSDSDPTSTFPGSTMRITAGGGIPYDARARAARGENVVPADTSNLLGELGADSNVGPTEMEFNVQLPSCHTMKERDRFHKLHFDTTYTNIQVHHWIKIVMRLSKPDAVDPTKRRHFEISIDSPFHILSCRATQANTSVPAYSSPESTGTDPRLFECGCPGAASRRNSPSSLVPTLGSLSAARSDEDTADGRPSTPTNRVAAPQLARPQAAHVHQPATHVERPMHLLRAPSYNPPAFEDEAPPPALITPPPQYDSIASPTSGLADYFSRLSDAYDDDDDSDSAHRDGRVNIPLTPGARINRSMDLGRNWVSVGQ